MKKNIKNEKKIGVVYTCITDNYDPLVDHKYINPSWDYVCFTDDLSIRSKNNESWKIKPLAFSKLDSSRNSRWHKLHPHVLFPEYDKSIWMDGSANIVSKNFYKDINRAVKKKWYISIGPHLERDCLYDEMKACIKLKKDDVQLVKEQMKLIKKDGFPRKYGLYETGIIYREHHNEIVKKLMNEWWWWIENHSRRDQLSLTYVLWKQKVNMPLLTKTAYRNNKSVKYIYKETHKTREQLVKEIQELNLLLKPMRSEYEQFQGFKKGLIWKTLERYRKIKSYLTGTKR